MRKLLLKVLFIIVASAIAASLSVIIVNRLNLHKKNSDAAYLPLLQDAYDSISKNYVEKIDEKKLAKSMIDGMLAALDPHSAYLPPEPLKEMEVQISGAFGGVGIELGMKDSKLIVIAPIDDTPAFRAGIQPNDHIWKINGALTSDMTIPAAVKRMRGKKGTPVTLGILRGGNSRPLAIRLVRDIIKIKSVKWRMLEPGYGMVRIAQFQERTGEDFKQALRDLGKAAGGQLKGLVLDLRYNPGGLVDSSVEVANCFIGGNANETLIVSIKGRMENTNLAYHATIGEKEPRYPMIVLINGGSASASEIVAGALQDHKRAIIMGQQSFGKGSVQSLIPLRGDAALKLTTARYYTPGGRSIQAKGITPDIQAGIAGPVEQKDVRQEGIKENDLANRLTPEGEQQGSGKAPQTAPAIFDAAKLKTGGESGVAGDYQMSRALDLLRSLALVRERGFMPEQ